MTKKTVWTIVILVGAYIAAQLVADVAATKLIVIFGVVMPAGTLIFAATFTLRDLLHKRLGVAWARAAIVMAVVMNLIMAAYLAWMASFPAPPFFELGDAWNAIFAVIPAITLGSIGAELVSELVDTEVYRLWKGRFENLPQWTRVVASNAVSIPLDSITFALLAFVVLPPLFGGESLPFSAAWAIVSGQIIFKAIVTAISAPTIYFVPDEQIELVSENEVVSTS